MTKLIRTLLFIILILNISTSIAQNDSKPWIVGLGANAVDYYPVIDGSLNPKPTNNTSGFGDEYFNVGDHWNNAIISKLQIGRYLGRGFTFEFSPSINKITKIGDYTISSQSYLALDGNIKYAIKNLLKKDESTFFQPYLYFGGGYTWLEDIGAGTANMGLGSNFWFSKKMGAAIQTGYKTDVENHYNSHFQHSLSIVYLFGNKEKEDSVVEETQIINNSVAEEKENTIAKETQIINNSVAEEKENTIAKETQIINNSAAEEKENTIAKEIQIINDSADKRKNSSFNNGTFNNCSFTIMNKCQDTTNPRTPNNFSTSEIKNLINPSTNNRYITFEKTIYFKTNFDRPFGIKIWSEAALNEVKSFALKYPSSTFEIEGHTDSRNSYNYNMNLSTRRANNVKNWLIMHGIEEFRLSTVAYGETKPIAPNDTEENMAKNRRVIVKMKGRILE